MWCAVELVSVVEQTKHRDSKRQQWKLNVSLIHLGGYGEQFVSLITFRMQFKTNNGFALIPTRSRSKAARNYKRKFFNHQSAILENVIQIMLCVDKVGNRLATGLADVRKYVVCGLLLNVFDFIWSTLSCPYDSGILIELDQVARYFRLHAKS